MNQSTKDFFKKIPPHLIVLGILGLIFLLLGNPLESDEDDPNTEINPIPNEEENFDIERSTEESQYKRQLEKDLETILSQVIGAGDVNAMITLEGSKKLDIAKNKDEEKVTTVESDGTDGKREITEEFSNHEVLTIRGQGDEPLVLREKKPAINGVLVVSEGANDVKVKKNLLTAVNTLFDVAEHNIVILPKNN
ncbi:hypothetical protein [Natranaerobius trueperi]|uniref:Stage III sporulation protein AG n=1 Tax=Natranaerobius trueperi TaxID=759412 RepID=A0A226BYL6_9FIRM|nr:hypothetical protein [Natranaerobius trueperi]OWZ84025.1 hypothetical protein CDO51_05560 [Natranaerobius trueperi]